jgi:hypothetical protein
MRIQQVVGIGLIILGIYVAFFGIPAMTVGTISISAYGVTVSELTVRQVESALLGTFFVLVGDSLLKRA